MSTSTTEPVLRPIRVLPIPDNRPAPYLGDARRLIRSEGDDAVTYVQGALAFDVRSDLDDLGDEQVLGQPITRRADLPCPRQWAGHLGQAIVEVLAGSRSAPQIVRWTTPEVYAVVARRGALAARRHTSGLDRTRGRHRAIVKQVVVCEPADGVAEATVIVIDGPRVRAVALRMVGQDSRWRVEALQIG